MEVDLPDTEEHPHALRVGWSVEKVGLGLGEAVHSYGYGGTGKSVENNRYNEYGEEYGPGDVIGCYVVSSCLVTSKLVFATIYIHFQIASYCLFLLRIWKVIRLLSASPRTALTLARPSPWTRAWRAKPSSLTLPQRTWPSQSTLLRYALCRPAALCPGRLAFASFASSLSLLFALSADSNTLNL